MRPLHAETPELAKSTKYSIEQALQEFLSRVPSLIVEGPIRIPIAELRDKLSPRYAKWGSSPGVYFFEQSDCVSYIGRALPGSGLRARVHNQCNAYGDPLWDAVIQSDATTVGIIVVPREEWYWAAALEPFLIDRLTPPRNRRSC